MNEYVWITSQKGYSDVPIGAHVLAAFGSRIKVKDDDYNELWISPDDILRPMHPTSILGVDDMITLGELQEYSILRNLKLRYTKDLIYTYIGSILVAVNPYRALPIYGQSKMLEYRRKGLGELAPHVFAIADSSYENMLKNMEKQCIVISGESGAGKTESTKLFLKYFAQISNKRSGKEEQILDSNPILEAFGNARTTRNDNSSRFGKYIIINFNSDGSIYSAQIKQYLLEKSRIVGQSKEEQNYHIFYSMLNGTSAEKKRRLGLKDASFYNYLNTTKDGPRADTHKNFSMQNVKSAMTVLNFTESDIWNISELLAAILHLGNIEYETVSISNIESVKINSSLEVQCVCKLLGVSKQELIESLSKKTISTQGENVAKLLSKQQAIDSRDAFAKRIYGNLFNFIVNKVNENLSKEQNELYIGILDIFGFEVFDRNSFEQLCINYANERLQQFFIAHIFKIEQEQYTMEGINWKYVEYTDNTEILELIEAGPTSVLKVIDDESKFPKSTDQTMLDKLIKFHSDNINFFKPKYQHVLVFGIKHFAGIVLYDVKDFLEKNHDACSLDMNKVVQSSRNSFLKEIFAEDFETNTSANFRKRTETLASKFKTSLDLLMAELNQCRPFFVRCIKPNDMKKPHKFDRELCCKQLRFSGMTETTKVREAGYAVRYDYVQFVQRYRVLCPGTALAHKTDCKEATKRICKTAFKNFSKADYQFGRTKIFLKHQEELFIEKERDKALYGYVVAIQKVVRGWLQRRRYLKLKNTVSFVENNWAGKQKNPGNFGSVNPDYEFYGYLVVRLQTYCRGYLVRKVFKKKLEHIKLKREINKTWKKDPSFEFQKFAQKYFQPKHKHKFTKKPIKTSLTRLLQPDDVAAAKALWLTILRFMGNAKKPKKSSKKISAKAQMRGIFGRIKGEKESSADEKALKQAENVNRLYGTWLKSRTDDLDKVHFVVGHGIVRPELRDEIYSQICKALTQNPSAKAVDRGWDLLKSCIGCFPPSDLFLKYLKSFIREGPNKYVSYCLFRLHRTLQNGPRSQPPCQTEFHAIAHQKPIELEVFLMNGTKTSAKIDSATTAREMLDIVAKNVKLADSFGFAIVIAQEMKRLSLGNDFVLDAIAECEQYAREVGTTVENAPWTLYLKKEMFAPWHAGFTSDDISSALICHQIIEGVKAEEYECQTQDLLRLVPQLCWVQRGKLNSSLSDPVFDEFLPHHFHDSEELERLKNEMKVIYHEMFKENPKPLKSVRDEIMKFAMKTWPLQFSKFFNVSGSIKHIKSSFTYPEVPLAVAVNHSGILIIDESNEKRVILELGFEGIREITRKEMVEGKGYILKIRSHLGVEISLVFKSATDSSLHELLVKLIETLKKFSKYVVAVKDYKALDESFLSMQKGDLIILSQKFRGDNLLQNSWAEGYNTKSEKTGYFLLDCVKVVPAIEKPSKSLIVAMAEDFLSGKRNQICQRADRLKHHTLEAYAVKHFFGNQTTKDEELKSNKPALWCCSTEKIRRPLHVKLQSDEQLSAKAVKMFEAILHYMEDKYNGTSEDDVQTTNKIFNPVLQNEALRDEVYCQIMKQLTSNPDRVGENRVWELMWMLTALVPCHSELVTEVKKFLQSRRTMQTARECLPRFYRILRSDPRKRPPHMIEIEAVKHRPCQILYKVSFPDDTHKFFQINSLMKAGDLIEIILNSLRISSSKEFNLFVVVADRLFTIPENYYIFDYFQLLNKWIEKDKVPTPNWQYQIYFMKKTWKEIVPGHDKFIDLTFLYPQEYNKYIQGYHKVTPEDIVQLARSLFKVYSVDGKSCQQILHKLIPIKASLLKKPEVWVKDINKTQFPRGSEVEGKMEFLKFLHKLPSYGSRYFWVKSEKSDLTNYILYPNAAYSSSDI